MPPDMRAALIGAVLALGAPLAAGAAPLPDFGPTGAPAVESGGIATGVHGQYGVREVDHRGFRDRRFRDRGFRDRGFRGKLHRRHHSGSRHFLHRPKRSPDIFFHPKRFHERRFHPGRFHHKRFHPGRFHHRGHRRHHALP